MSNGAAFSHSNSRNTRHASFQSKLYAPATHTPLVRALGNRRHSHYPIPSAPPLGNRTACISIASAKTDQSNTATRSDSHGTASQDPHTLPRASFLAPEVHRDKANFSNPTSLSKLQNVQVSELFECVSPLEFGSQGAASLQGIPDTTLPICSTPNLSKSPASPNTPSSPSTPSQHESLADLDLHSCADLLAFHRDSLASRQRTSAMSSFTRNNFYHPSSSHRSFLSPYDAYITAPSTPEGHSTYSPDMPKIVTHEAPKSAPPLDPTSRRLRRQGIDFHSIPQFTQHFEYRNAVFETESSTISTLSHTQVQYESIPESGSRTEDTQETVTEAEFDSEDFSWEAEDADCPLDPDDGYSEFGPDVPGSDDSAESSFLDFFCSTEWTIDDDDFSHSDNVKGRHSFIDMASPSSSSLALSPTLPSHPGRPVLPLLTVPSTSSPWPPSSPMSPYGHRPWQDGDHIPAPRDLPDSGTAYISNSTHLPDADGELPRSAFDSDSDFESYENIPLQPQTKHKPAGKLRRLKDALKGSVSMPSMRAAKAKQATGERTSPNTPSSSSSTRFSHLPPPPTLPKAPSHSHTASLVSTLSAISIVSRSSSTPGTTMSTTTTSSSNRSSSSHGHLSPVEHFLHRATSRGSHKRGSKSSSVSSHSPYTPNRSSLEADHVDQRRLNSNLAPSSYHRPRSRPSTSASTYSTYSSRSLSSHGHVEIAGSDEVGRSEGLKRRATSPLNPWKSLLNLSVPTSPPDIPLPPLPPLPTSLTLQSFEHISPRTSMAPSTSASAKKLSSESSVPLAVTVTDINNTARPASTKAGVDDGLENRKALLEESMAKLQTHMPQGKSYTWGDRSSSSRPSLPSKIQWLADCNKSSQESKPEVRIRSPAKNQSVVVSPTTLQRLDFSGLTASPASCYSTDSPSQEDSSASPLLDVTEAVGRDVSRSEDMSKKHRAPLLPHFDFESTKPKYPTSLKDGTCGQYKKPVVVRHIRKSSSLSDLSRLSQLNSSNIIAARPTFTHPTRSTNHSTSSSASSSALPTPSDSSPAISRTSSATSSVYSTSPSIIAQPDHSTDCAPMVTPFLYRSVQKGYLSSSGTLRPPRSSSNVNLPFEQQPIIQTSIRRNDVGGTATDKKSKVKKLLGRVGSTKKIRNLSIRD